MKGLPSAREINAHLASCSSYCYVYGAGNSYSFRITRARTRKGVLEGRFLNGQTPSGGAAKDWEVIPVDATVELS